MGRPQIAANQGTDPQSRSIRRGSTASDEGVDTLCDRSHTPSSGSLTSGSLIIPVHLGTPSEVTHVQYSTRRADRRRSAHPRCVRFRRERWRRGIGRSRQGRRGRPVDRPVLPLGHRRQGGHRAGGRPHQRGGRRPRRPHARGHHQGRQDRRPAVGHRVQQDGGGPGLHRDPLLLQRRRLRRDRPERGEQQDPDHRPGPGEPVQGRVQQVRLHRRGHPRAVRRGDGGLPGRGGLRDARDRGDHRRPPSRRRRPPASTWWSTRRSTSRPPTSPR
jgi:hypothetical protein